MPSTYTLNNGIELIATGEQSGTWGDTTNTNLGLLDTALDGQVTVTLPSAGTSGSPNTLAISDGAASDGRNRMVIFNDGGDLGATAYVQLTPNDAEKIIYVRNDLAGSRSIILFQGTYNASNDYELPAGTTAVIYFDGAGSGAVAANVFNNAYFDSLRLGSVSVTEIIDDDTMATASATNIATSESIKAYVDTQVGANNELSEVLANGNTTGGTDISVSSGDDITFADSSKAIFGAGSDLQIYHDGTRSIIQDNGDGNLRIQANNLELNNADNSENYLFAANNGAVTLYYDNAAKIATTSTGIDVTGTVNIDSTSFDPASGWGASQEVSPAGLNFEDNGTTTGNLLGQTYKTDSVTWGTNRLSGFFGMEKTNGTGLGDFVWWLAPTNYAQNPAQKMRIASNGDITFYDTSGNASFVYDESAGSTFNEQGDSKDFRVESSGQTHMLFVDGANNRVGIGTSSPGRLLTLFENDQPVFQITNNTSGAANTRGLIQYMANGTTDAVFDNQGSGSGGMFRFMQAGTERLRMTTSAFVANEGGSDYDFRVESDTNTHALFVDAGNSQVVVGTSSPITGVGAVMTVGGGTDTRLAIDGSSSAGLYLSDSGAQGITIRNASGDLEFYGIATREFVFNEGGIDTDFRVESSGTANMFQVDAGSNVVNINSNNVAHDTATKLQVAGRVRFGSSYGAETSGMTTPTNSMILTKESFSPTSGATRIYGLSAQNSGYAASGSTAPMAVLLGGWNSGSSRAGGIEYDPSTYNLYVMAGATGAGQTGFQDTGRVASFNSSSIVFNEQGNNQDFRVESDSYTNMFSVDASQNTVHVGSDQGSSVMNIYATGRAGVIALNVVKQDSGNGTGTLFNTTNNVDQDFQIRVSEVGATTKSAYLGPSTNTQMNLTGAQVGNLYRDLYLDGASLVVNQDSRDYDFRVEGNGNSHLMFADAGIDAVAFGTSSTVSNHRVTIAGTGGDRSQPLEIIGTGTAASFSWLIGARQENLGSGQRAAIFVGKAESTYNMGAMYHYHYGDGSASNELRWGLFGADDLLRLSSAGNLIVAGSLSKGSGSFRIDHPIASKSATHDLVHSFVEAPQADNIYRGKVDLVAGQATVNIDTVAGMTEGTFALLNREIQCFTSNETGWTAVRGSVSGNILTIEAQDNTCTDTISWLVIGERQDQHMYDTNWTDENGKVIVEPEKTFDVPQED